jgi:hypothetical protein
MTAAISEPAPSAASPHRRSLASAIQPTIGVPARKPT